MKIRIVAVILILSLILAGTLGSSLLLYRTQSRLDAALAETARQARRADWSAAERTARRSQQFLQQKTPLLACFLAEERLSELACTLSTLPVYAHQQDDALLAETERARSQLRALSRLFFRTL